MRHLILLLPIVIASCATTRSTGGAITVETRAQGQELTGANCIVTINGGNWNIVTPATVAIGNANGDLRVVCNKDGYRTSEVIYRPSSPHGSSVGLGAAGGSGNVGVGVGLSFPVRLGGGSYPARVTVDMNPQ